MIEQHAHNHADRIRFPTNQGKDYIIERGKYTKMAYGRLQQNWMNAEDAVNEAYLSILEHPPKKPMNEKEFEAFFTVVLLGVVGKMFRSDKAKEINMVSDAGKNLQYLESEDDADLDDFTKREEIVAVADEETNPESAFVAKEMLALINREIDKLKFTHRQIVALNVLYGYKPREIQAITGDTSAKIRMTIFYFRETMKEKLQ